MDGLSCKRKSLFLSQMQPDVLSVNNITQSTFACLRRRHNLGHRFAIETWE